MNKLEVQLLHTIYLGWSLLERGFGQIYFYQSDDGTILCDNELLDKDTIKQILNVMVDQCVLTCPKSEE